MLDKIQNSLDNELPFVVYAKPNSLDVNGIFQQDDSLYYLEDFSQKGFVMAPFDNASKSVLLPLDKSIQHQESWGLNNLTDSETTPSSYSETDKQEFERLVSDMIAEINFTKTKKIVASRKETFIPEKIEVTALYQKMFHKYPNAFRYCFYHPQVGLWLGATPEKLLSIMHRQLQTMGYAGTQRFEGTTDVIWHEKEREEQQFVTEFILDNLIEETETIEVSVPYTSQAGTLLHLRTDIKAELKQDFSIQKIIEKLHPTPAVCGFPKQKAKEYILANEGYNRSFYSGYLGELNFTKNNDSELYVNLRCMEIQDKEVQLYIGCGITKDSNPEKEFIETVNKSITMKSLF